MQSTRKEYWMGTSDLRESSGNAIRTAGCILLFCEKGYGIVSANFERRVFRKGDIAIIFPDTLFVINRLSKDFSVRYIEVSSDIFDEATFSLSSHFFDIVYDNPIFPTTCRHRELLELWERQVKWIMQCSLQKSSYMMMRNQMQNFFIGIESELLPDVRAKNIKPISSTRQLFNRFCRLLAENCYVQHDVRFYADKLCITPYYLSKITLKTLGLSPKELIDRQIIMEMKRVLISTDLSAKEIADRFHFETTSYMGRYFRRHTGLTPSEYREQQ
ncbi:MAG: helix-turn-helix domain-containing protein, partial [Alistipes sp.]|uniref:helix-turn-helix domain-containing protein n=1 Tax=Alistipes sp. TaxID=1872444 RepID=UPI0025BC6B74